MASIFRKHINSLVLLIALLINATVSYSACPGTVTASFAPSPLLNCGVGPVTVNFTNNSSGVNAGSADYDWYINGTQFDNTTGLSAPNSTTITAVGNYTFMLVAIDNIAGCEDTTSYVFTIYNAPTAGFTFNNNNTCAGTTINFNNTSTGAQGSTQYSWNFGDGGTSSQVNPSYTYSAGGTYTVIMTMTNAPGCASNFTQTITVLDIPVPNIAGDDGDGNLTYCLFPGDGTTSETVTFSNTTTGAVSYDWDFGDGSPVFSTNSLTSFPHVYSSYGTYTVTMTAYGANGCPVTSTLTVVFEKFVSAALTLDITEYNGCAPHLLSTLQNLSVNANTYVWNFGDGSVITSNNFAPPAYSYATAGIYTITLTASNSCNTATATISPIIIIGGPTANFTPSVFNGCAPQVETFVNSSSNVQPNNNYYWDMGNGNTYTNTITPPAQTYNNAGTYNIMLVAGNSCSNDTLYQTIVIDTIPVLDLIVTPDEGCTPLISSSNATATGGNLTWAWYVDGVYAGAAPNTIPDQTFTTPPGNTVTNHSIQAIVTNTCGTDDSIVNIIVHPAVQSIFSATSTICAGTSTTFTDGSYGDSLTWSWDFGEGTTANTQGPHTITYPTAGTYTAQLTVVGYCGTDVMTTTITVLDPPTLSLTVNPNEGCTPLTVSSNATSSVAGVTWNWNINGVSAYSTPNTIPDQTFTTPVGNTASNYTIQAVITNICGTDDSLVNIVVHPLVQSIFTGNNSICEGDSITFTESSNGDILSWEWDFGEGTTNTTQGPHTITYPTAGTYTVQLIVNGFCGPDTSTMAVTVLPIPIADIIPDNISGCESNTYTFTNNSTAGGTYAWNFGPEGSPATSSLFTPTPVSFIDSGYQMIILNVDVLGCLNADTTYITVNPLPIPVFSATPTNGCTPLDVSFTNTSTTSPGDTYFWDFGNGNTFNNQNPGNETYIALSNDSIYNVWLYITSGSSCIDSISQTITVHPLPIANFSPSNDTVCAQDIVNFSNNSLLANSYTWNFGDGNTSATINPTNTYSNPGNYTVQLIASTPFSCTDTITSVIVVDSIPTPNFTFTIECVGTTTQFTDASLGGAVFWEWDFGDGSPLDNNQNPSHLYATSGTYTVSLTVRNPANCPVTISLPVVVNDVPVANFSNSSTCLGQTTAFTDLTTGVPISWAWNFGDGSPIDNNQNPNYSYASPGSYTTTLIVGGGSGCYDTISQVLTVDSIPTANYSSVFVCMNDTTFFTNSTTGGPDTYFWDFGDGTTDATNNQNPTHIYTADGSYVVTLVASYSASGCSDTMIQVVDAFPRTVPNFSNNTPCLGATTNFTDATLNTPTSWTWNFGDGSPTNNSQNPNYAYATDGFYTVQLITENTFGCIDTFASTIQVFPLPIASFTFDTVCEGFISTFTDLSTSAVLWEWDFGDGTAFDLNQSPTHLFTNFGTYNTQLVVTNSDGCTDTIVQTIIVNENPIANFGATVACFSYPTFFSDSSYNTSNWQWNFGDGSPLNNNQNPNTTYAFDGNYNATLTVTSPLGCMDSITKLVTVLPQPQAGFDNPTVCAGQVVSFNDTTTGTPDQWSWDFGDGSPLDNSQNPIHTYALGGTYNITLISGNSAGCYDTLNTTIDVFTVPTPAFSADTVCLFNVTNFTDLSVDAVPIVSWDWDFGDGNTSFSQNPTYIYQTDGTFPVTLTIVNDNGCDSTVTIPVIVNAIPVASFTFDTVCLGSPTTFTDISTGVPVNWTWDFGDGNTSNTGPTTQYTYATSGVYLVSMIVDGGAGCIDQTFNVVTVSDVVTAGITTPDSVCFNDPINFLDNSVITSGLITDYTWDFGDGSPIVTTQDALYTFSQTGTYTVTHTATSENGCLSTITQDITVNELPSSNFNATTPCEGQATDFTDLSNVVGGTISNWLWDFGDGSPSDNTQNPSHTYATAGIYNVTLTVTSNSGCIRSITLPVEIYAQPVANFTSNTVCPGDSTQLTDASISTSNYTVAWDFDDGNTSNVYNPNHVFPTLTDSFYVQLIVTTDVGCIDTIQQYVVTNPIVLFDFSPIRANGCAPLAVDFADNSTTTGGGGIIAWVWDFGDSLYGFNQNPSHTYIDAGDYYASLTVTTVEGCSFNSTLTYPITVYPQPIAGFSSTPTDISINDPEVQFIDESTDALYWEWDFGDGSQDNYPNPTYVYGDTGYYYITQIVTNNFGCSDTANGSVYIHGEYAFFAPNAFTPNGDGNNDYFFGTGFGYEDYHLMIFDRWGLLIFETYVDTDYWDGTYKGSEVQQDVYVWKVIIKDIYNQPHSYYGHVSLIR